MPFRIEKTDAGLLLELSGAVTARDAAEMSTCLGTSFTGSTAVVVRTSELEDIDTSILQMLVSLRKTAASFAVRESSEAFLSAAERCALRRELAISPKEIL